jgi:hypothetical protein
VVHSDGLDGRSGRHFLRQLAPRSRVDGKDPGGFDTVVVSLSGVSPFDGRAVVRPEILYTEDAREPRSATEKVSMSPDDEAPRTDVRSRWRCHQRISVALSGSPASYHVNRTRHAVARCIERPAKRENQPFSSIAVRAQPAGQLRDKIEERVNEPRDLHFPSWRGNHTLSTTRATRPSPVMPRRKIPLPCRLF